LPLQAGALLLLALFQLHLVRRALETRLLLRYSRDDVMHGIAYVFGMRYVEQQQQYWRCGAYKER
jgi:hypothetical protein